MSEKLLPCPHCGGSDVRFDRHVHGSSPTGEIWSMCCYDCGATFPNRYRKELLVNAWNTRADGWQPIETAPKDGTRILLWTTTDGDAELAEYISTINGQAAQISIAQIGSWDSGNPDPDPMWTRSACWEIDIIGNPTHWMPIPTPPEAESRTNLETIV